jgi:hypothetical protein
LSNIVNNLINPQHANEQKFSNQLKNVKEEALYPINTLTSRPLKALIFEAFFHTGAQPGIQA